MSDALAHQAAALWGLDPARVSLAARRENIVYRADGRGQSFALRLHRPGYRTEAELRSELQWMGALAAGGMAVPQPVPMPDGRLIAMLGDTPVDLLTWLPGRPLGAQGALEGITDRTGVMRAIGAALARLHDLSDAWAPPAGFTRPAWDRAGLLGPAPLWGRFWEHPHLTGEERDIFLSIRQRLEAALITVEDSLDYGLIHADAITENILIAGDTLSLIDFDDGGWGFRDFDLATTLMRQIDAPDYAALRTALLDGYASRRTVDPETLGLMLVARALTYPGWIIPRMDEPGGAERSRRALDTALPLARRWLDGETP